MNVFTTGPNGELIPILKNNQLQAGVETLTPAQPTGKPRGRPKKVVVPTEASVVRIKLSKPQLKKIKYGHTFRIKPENIGHPEGFPIPKLGRHNRVLLHDAKTTGKPTKIVLMDEELEGSGIKEFFQGVGRFFKNNWKTIKPIVSTVLDLGAPALAKAFPQAGPAILSGRELIRQTTGTSVGMDGGSFLAKGLIMDEPPRRRMCAGRLAKGSPEAKAHMAKLRAMRGGRVSN